MRVFKRFYGDVGVFFELFLIEVEENEIAMMVFMHVGS